MVKLIDYETASNLLLKYNIKVVESRYLSDAKAAVKFADGKPITLKVISQKALHKTKSGLIELNLYTDDQIKDAYAKLSVKAEGLRPYKILGQSMIKNGIEIIIGGNTDPQFGKLVLIGLGGIYVETFKDTALRVCPITRDDAGLMIDQLRSGLIIAPNSKAKKMLEDILLSASKMFYENDIVELDLNPVILHDDTYDVVDIRILK